MGNFLKLRTIVGRMLCRRGSHDLVYCTSGLACYCKREGCDYYWEYD